MTFCKQIQVGCTLFIKSRTSSFSGSVLFKISLVYIYTKVGFCLSSAWLLRAWLLISCSSKVIYYTSNHVSWLKRRVISVSSSLFSSCFFSPSVTCSIIIYFSFRLFFGWRLVIFPFPFVFFIQLYSSWSVIISKTPHIGINLSILYSIFSLSFVLCFN